MQGHKESWGAFVGQEGKVGRVIEEVSALYFLGIRYFIDAYLFMMPVNASWQI